MSPHGQEIHSKVPVRRQTQLTHRREQYRCRLTCRRDRGIRGASARAGRRWSLGDWRRRARDVTFHLITRVT